MSRPPGSDSRDFSAKASTRCSIPCRFFPLGGLTPELLAADSDEEHLDPPGARKCR